MDRLVFNSGAAIREQATVRQSLVNELANIATTGFKRSYEVALRSVKAEGDGFDTRYQSQAVADQRIQLNPGPVMATGRPLDIAIAGKAVLGVQAENGELAFSRRGDLRLGVNGALEDGQGRLVMGQGGPVTVPPGFLVSINPDGTVFATDPNQPTAPGVFIDQLLLRDASQVNLSRRADGLFMVDGQAPGSDFASGPEAPRLIPQALEGSNVNAVTTMVKLMDHARTFEAQIRVIKEAKSLDESGSSMMRNA
jgi:flagellar basal-body rod protein FlgF